MALTLRNTAIVLDSTADMPDAAERHPNWRVVPLYVHIGGETRRDYVDLTPEELYRRLPGERELPTTSQPSPADFTSVFDDVASYEHVVCLCISSKLSGTYASAMLAADLRGDEHLLVVDSRTVSGGTVLLAEAIQRRLERETSEEELLRLIDRYRAEAGFLLTVGQLEYLIRGGRIGRASGLAGQLLSVKPIIRLADGELVPVKRVRGRGKSLAELEEAVAAAAGDGDALHVAVMHADARGDADTLAAAVRKRLPAAAVDVMTTFGAVLGAHVGPGALALAWFHDEG
jgi:DegV family protein with EDD domain